MLSCKYARFSLPKKITYLNCAYMAPLLKSVEKAGIRGVRLKRNPINISPGDFFTTTRLLREAFAQLINANDADRIAIIPSASYGISTVAHNLHLEKGDEIIVAAEQFPSNYYAWERRCSEVGATLRMISPGEGSEPRGKRWNQRILESIGPRTRAVAIANVHWADGTLFDLQAIRSRTHEVNARLIIDGTQSVGAYPFDVEKIQPDALVCASYKWLLGPYSLGLAWYGEWMDEGKPIEENWINRRDSDNFSALINYTVDYMPGAQRYSVGEQSNFILVPMALKAIQQINRWGVDNIQEYCRNITSAAIDTLREKGFEIEELPFRASHLFGIRHPAIKDVDALKHQLLAANIHVSARGTAVRVSPHVYNDEEDLQKLVRVLIKSIG